MQDCRFDLKSNKKANQFNLFPSNNSKNGVVVNESRLNGKMFSPEDAFSAFPSCHLIL